MRIEFNEAGFKELLTSAATKKLVKRHADEMVERANDSASTTEPAATEPYYEVKDGTDGKRARYYVQPAEGEQLTRNIRHEAKTQALQKSL